jgi:hypothetical protein
LENTMGWKPVGQLRAVVLQEASAWSVNTMG